MAEYLSPGVYIEEVSYRSTKAIAGVGTTTTGFIGPTRYGPVDLQLQLITSLDDYERTYGDGQLLQLTPLNSSTGPLMSVPNFMWQAARAFFTQGGTQLYVSRVVSGLSNNPPQLASAPLGGSPTAGPVVSARYPGAFGNMQVQIIVRVGPNVLSFVKNPVTATPPLPPVAQVGSVEVGDVVMIRAAAASTGSPPTSSAASFPAYLAGWDPVAKNWVFEPGASSPNSAIPLGSVTQAMGLEIRVITLAVVVTTPNPNQPPQTWSNLALDASHQTSGVYDSFVAVFGADPTNPTNPDPAYGMDLPIFFTQNGPTGKRLNGLGFLQALFASYQGTSTLPDLLQDLTSTDAQRSIYLNLQGGTDGGQVEVLQYEGSGDPSSTTKTGLVQFEDLEDISIVAAPGSTYLMEAEGAPTATYANSLAIMQELVAHCEQMQYRIAVLDCGNGENLNQVTALRGQFDSSYAALYYPWVRILDPITSNPIYLPPSGFMCGIYANNDIRRGVFKAPANEVVALAQGFEVNINKAQQDLLNPLGINCLRFFEGRGYLVWGARTCSSDTDWIYVNIRRYFAYLERSIDLGTQWAAFEPNGQRLWAKVQASVTAFLTSEWQSGALAGSKPEQAFFVRCDQTTMSQQDLDLGRLICLVGVAALRPAEFVIFRIGQWTGDRTS
jgi:phage tail sheath protein FI